MPKIPTSPVSPLDALAANPSHTLRRCHVDAFYQHHAALLPVGCRVLDIGGVRKPVMPGMFSIARYNLDVTCLNIQSSANPDVIAAAEKLPFANGCFDAIICSEVLEHVADPLSALSEIRRVLRPNGTALITVPFLYYIHASPYDFARYTEYFWRQNLPRQGFAILSLAPQGLWHSVMMDFIRFPIEQAARNSRSPLFRKLMTALLVGPIIWLRRWALSREAKLMSKNPNRLSPFVQGYGMVVQAIDIPPLSDR